MTRRQIRLIHQNLMRRRVSDKLKTSIIRIIIMPMRIAFLVPLKRMFFPPTKKLNAICAELPSLATGSHFTVPIALRHTVSRVLPYNLFNYIISEPDFYKVLLCKSFSENRYVLKTVGPSCLPSISPPRKTAKYPSRRLAKMAKIPALHWML